MTDSASDISNSGPKNRWRIARVALALISLPFSIGILAGILGAHQNHGGGAMSATLIAIIAGVGLLIALALAVAVRELIQLYRQIETLPRRERATVRWLTFCLVGGAIVGALSGALSVGNNWFGGPNGAIPAALSLALVAVLLSVGPYMTHRWWLAIDEHEQTAYLEGSYSAGHFVLYAGIAWWLLHRANLVPAPDVMALLVAMSTVWMIVWFYKKYR